MAVGLLLAVSVALKIEGFAGVVGYVESNLHTPRGVSMGLLVGLIAFEVLLAGWLIFRPTRSVVKLAGWLFVGFAAWHVGGLLMGLSTCPCFGMVTARLNGQTMQVLLLVLCAGVGMGLLSLVGMKKEA